MRVSLFKRGLWSCDLISRTDTGIQKHCHQSKLNSQHHLQCRKIYVERKKKIIKSCWERMSFSFQIVCFFLFKNNRRVRCKWNETRNSLPSALSWWSILVDSVFGFIEMTVTCLLNKTITKYHPLIIIALTIILLLVNFCQSFYTKRRLQCPQMKSFQLIESANTL